MKSNWKRGLCGILVLAMLLSLSTPSVSMAAKKKAIKLNKSKLTLAVGQTAKLKVKNTKKKVKWSSSKKSVATISKKGKVKAKKAGKTTITAKIGKKKLKCKVTVTAAKTTATPVSTTVPTKAPVVVPTKAPTNPGTEVVPTQKPEVESEISSLVFENSDKLVVTLKNRKELDITNFEVKTKVFEEGTYNYIVPLYTVTTEDFINYNIELNSDITEGCYVQVTVTDNKGKKSTIEGFYYDDKTQVKQTRLQYKTGQSVSKKLYVDGIGYLNFQSVDLPSGLTYVSGVDSWGDAYINITGKITETGYFEKELVWKDEMGVTYTYKIQWLIGSADTIIVHCEQDYVTMQSTSVDVATNFYVSGGSGSYTYNIADESVTVTTSNQGVGTLKKTFTETGTHEIEIEIMDANNEEIKTTFIWVLNIAQARKIAMRVLDAKGEPITYETRLIEAKAQDAESPYINSVKGTIGNSSYESIDMYLVDGLWDITVEVEGYKYEVKDYEVKGEDTTLDIETNLYKVSVTQTPENLGDLDEMEWYDGTILRGIGESFYAPAGNISYLATVYDKIYKTKYQASCNVSAEAEENVASVTLVEEGTAINGIIDTTSSPIVTLDYKHYQFYKFIPTEDGTYQFQAESVLDETIDSYGILYDGELNKLKTDDDSGEGWNFSITYECVAGQTYYIGVDALGNRYDKKKVYMKVDKIEEVVEE